MAQRAFDSIRRHTPDSLGDASLIAPTSREIIPRVRETRAKRKARLATACQDWMAGGGCICEHALV